MANKNSERDEFGALPTELQELHRQLQADSAAWNRHAPSPERLIARYNAMLEQRRLNGATQARSAGGPSPDSTIHPERRYIPMPSKRLSGVLAVFLAAALIAGTILIFRYYPTKNKATAPTPATVTPLQVSASQGWVRPSAIAFGKDIAFAPNAPLTGYVCGNNVTTPTSTVPAIRFSVTHDGGRSWRELAATPSHDGICEISIDPTDANDVILLDTDKALRSHDGGQTWTPLALPADSTFHPTTNLFFWPIWAGSTLFLHFDLPTNATRLAASVGGGVLKWVDDAPIFHPTSSAYVEFPSAGWQYAIGKTFYANFTLVTSCTNVSPTSSQCTQAHIYIKTGDGGATWSQYTPPKGTPDIIWGTLADRQTLLGENDITVTNGNNRTIPMISRDGGQTWSELPPLPYSHTTDAFLPFGNERNVSGDGVVSTPDGTIYAEQQNIEYDSKGNFLRTTGPDTLLKLVPGTSAWAVVGGLPSSITFGVSADIAGHPIAIWGGVENGAYQAPGISYHAP